MFKDLYPLSDYTTGYTNGGDDNSGSGVFCDHGNHTQANTGSQTLHQYYHFGIMPDYTFVYVGSEYFRRDEPGIFGNALSTVEFWMEYDGSLTNSSLS